MLPLVVYGNLSKMEKPEQSWEYEEYPRSIMVEPGNGGCVEISVQYKQRWGGEYTDIVLPRDKAIEMANYILSLCNEAEADDSKEKTED